MNTTTCSPNTIGANTARQGHVSEWMERLDKEISQACDQSEALEVKLHPILRSQPPIGERQTSNLALLFIRRPLDAGLREDGSHRA